MSILGFPSWIYWVIFFNDPHSSICNNPRMTGSGWFLLEIPSLIEPLMTTADVLCDWCFCMWAPLWAQPWTKLKLSVFRRNNQHQTNTTRQIMAQKSIKWNGSRQIQIFFRAHQCGQCPIYLRVYIDSEIAQYCPCTIKTRWTGHRCSDGISAVETQQCIQYQFNNDATRMVCVYHDA